MLERPAFDGVIEPACIDWTDRRAEWPSVERLIFGTRSRSNYPEGLQLKAIDNSSVAWRVPADSRGAAFTACREAEHFLNGTRLSPHVRLERRHSFERSRVMVLFQRGCLNMFRSRADRREETRQMLNELAGPDGNDALSLYGCVFHSLLRPHAELMARRRRWLLGGEPINASLEEVRRVHLAPENFAVLAAHVRLGDAGMLGRGEQAVSPLFEAHASCIAKVSAELSQRFPGKRVRLLVASDSLSFRQFITKRLSQSTLILDDVAPALSYLETRADLAGGRADNRSMSQLHEAISSSFFELLALSLGNAFVLGSSVGSSGFARTALAMALPPSGRFYDSGRGCAESYIRANKTMGVWQAG